MVDLRIKLKSYKIKYELINGLGLSFLCVGGVRFDINVKLYNCNKYLLNIVCNKNNYSIFLWILMKNKIIEINI